jgi:hypothetical protein
MLRTAPRSYSCTAPPLPGRSSVRWTVLCGDVSRRDDMRVVLLIGSEPLTSR